MEPFDRLGIRELFQLLVHRFPEKPEGMGDAPAENDRFGVVGIEDHHHQPPDMSAEFVPQRQRRGIARQGTLVGFLARRAAAYEETAAAIVFVIPVQIRDASDLPRPVSCPQ